MIGVLCHGRLVMIYPGLVSISFRGLTCRELVRCAARCGLAGIEWGGDVHVPHGDVAKAREVRAMMASEGLRTAAYGSYYRVGCSPGEGLTFEQVLDSALALGTSLVRVWAGRKGSAEISESDYQAIVDDGKRIAEMAERAGLAVAFEHHSGTLADSAETAHKLCQDISTANVRCYWQPLVGLGAQEREAGLRLLAGKLAHLHVFQWTGWPGQIERHPLRAGAAAWDRYLRIAAEAGGERYAMLEFVKDDSVVQMTDDARSLKRLIDDAIANPQSSVTAYCRCCYGHPQG